MDTSRREAPWRLALGLFCLLVSQGSCGISPQANAFPIAAETSSSIPSPVFGGGGDLRGQSSRQLSLVR